jgi:hypothetical protein
MPALLSPVRNSRVYASLLTLAALSGSCASSRRADPGQSNEENERPRSSSSRDAAEGGSAEVYPEAGSGAERACRGPGDCPRAAWEGPEDAGAPSGDAGRLAGCAKSDILAELELEPGADCGDVPLKAASEITQLALACARDALAASKPFHLFWSVVATDSVNHLGVIARRDGDALQIFIASLVPANTFGSGYKGDNARWTECDNARVICEDSVDRCFKCQPTEREACVCAPANEIQPIMPKAFGSALSCVSLQP